LICEFVVSSPSQTVRIFVAFSARRGIRSRLRIAISLAGTNSNQTVGLEMIVNSILVAVGGRFANLALSGWSEGMNTVSSVDIANIGCAFVVIIARFLSVDTGWYVIDEFASC
jgi:hypothetical protein